MLKINNLDMIINKHPRHGKNKHPRHDKNKHPRHAKNKHPTT